MLTSSRKRRHSRLGKCDICRSIDAKYTCPRCDTVTCSLECVRRHKSELDCDGVRVKTKFVPVNQMNECTFLSDYRLLEQVARCVEEAEWKRETLEMPLQAVVDSSCDDPEEVVSSEPASVVDSNDAKEQSVAASEQCDNKTEPFPICEVNAKKSKKRKKKNKNPAPSDPLTKTDILIAKAERIRQQILSSRKIKQTENVLQNEKVLKKLPEENNEDSNKYELGHEDDEEGEIVDDDDEVDDKENSSSSPQESSDSYNSSSSSSGSSSPDENDDIEEVIEDDENQLPDEVPFSTTVEMTPSNDLNEDKSKGNGQEKQMNDSTPEVEERKLSKEELLQIKKEKLRAAVALGGTKKEMKIECLASAAFSRGIHLATLPERFEKHWENSSFYVSNEDCIYWRLKVSFINANFYTLSLNECPETITLENVITGCLQQCEQFYGEHGRDDPLLVYRTIDFSKISALMIADKLPNNHNKFYVLDPAKSLRENFRGKCIVEFPHLCIAIEDCYVVSQVQEKLVSDFFQGDTFEGDEEYTENPEPSNEFERKWKRMGNKERKKREEKEHRKHVNRENASEKESGELTDSSSSDSSSSDSDSEEELFKESEFRSIYKDLLTTFDIDVNQLQK